MRRTSALAISLLAAVDLMDMGRAGQTNTRVNVQVIVVGPSLPVSEHPHLANARILHQDDEVLFQAIQGSPKQVRQALFEQLVGWQWQQDDLSEDGRRWEALGHSPQGKCMRAQARAVTAHPMVRLRTQRCDKR